MSETVCISKFESINGIKDLTIEIKKHFSSRTDDPNVKWSLLNTYRNQCLLKQDFNKTVVTSYVTVLSSLIDALQPTLFLEKWQETLFDEIFLSGVLHESFLILVKRLELSEKYVLQKIINLLQKFIQSSTLEDLFLYQCMSHQDWDLKYVSKSNVWDDLITSIVSLPERIANKTQGKFIKIFSPASYVPLLISSVFKVLSAIHERLRDSQDCSLEFLAKLTGRLCLIGNADIVAKKFSKEFINVGEADFIWRRISRSFITKMPSNSLDSFIINLLVQIPWYGYVEWILDDEGIKNEKINYIMTTKILFFRPFKQAIVLQNTIGYFASSPHRVSHFTKILNTLLDSWIDERALKYQSIEQKTYIALALMVCAGWLKQLKLELINNDYISKVLKGTQIRLESSEDTVRFLGMIVGEHLLKFLCPDSPPLEFECTNKDLVNQLKSMMEIPLKPSDNLISSEDFKCFEEAELQRKNVNNSEVEVPPLNEELDSDDDLEPYDLSNDVPVSELKRPLYLRECMMGLLEQENVEWTEQCMKHAEELIKANPYAAEEIAEEMAKITLHLTERGCISDFVALRHRILIALTVQCPIVVANYLITQFTERDYTIRQRLDILEVLAASSALLSHANASLPTSGTQPAASNEDFVKNREADWQIIVNQRLEEKTKRYTKAQIFPFKENKFSSIAGNFFYPLLNSYEKACKILRLHSDDSYVLGRFIYSLGIIMCSASNTLHCREIGTTFLQFLSTVRSHKDVFVRQAIIFAVAATYTAVPSSLLLTEMLPEVTDTTEWLQNVAQNDPDGNCVEKALYTLSIFQSAASEGSLMYQLNSLLTSK